MSGFYHIAQVQPTHTDRRGRLEGSKKNARIQEVQKCQMSYVRYGTEKLGSIMLVEPQESLQCSQKAAALRRNLKESPVGRHFLVSMKEITEIKPLTFPLFQTKCYKGNNFLSK